MFTDKEIEIIIFSLRVALKSGLNDVGIFMNDGRNIAKSILSRLQKGTAEKKHKHEVTLWFDTEEDMNQFCKEIENGTAKFVKE